MVNNNCFFFDTSFIFCLDDDKGLKDKINYLLGFFYTCGCKIYISNIVINELYQASEKIWYDTFLTKNAILEGEFTKTQFDSSKSQVQKKMLNEYAQKKNYTLKVWRSDSCYTQEYKLFAKDYFNILYSNLKGLDIEFIVNYESLSWADVVKKIIALKDSYSMLDTNDINHYLIADNYNLGYLITCDNDFQKISDATFSDLKIINLYKMNQKDIEIALNPKT